MLFFQPRPPPPPPDAAYVPLDPVGEDPPEPTATTLTLVTLAGATHEYVPGVVYDIEFAAAKPIFPYIHAKDICEHAVVFPANLRTLVQFIEI